MKVIKTTLFNNKKTKTSIIESLTIFENFLRVLKKLDLGSERMSTDTILQFQVDMDKTEVLPLLNNDDEKNFSLFWDTLFEIYRNVFSLSSLLVAFYDKAVYTNDAKMYSSFISIQYDEITGLKNIIERFLSRKSLTRNLLENNSRTYLSFKRELFRFCADTGEPSSNLFHSEILSILKKINTLNKNILENLSDLYERVADPNENIYEILEETEKAFSKTKFVFNTLLNANKY